MPPMVFRLRVELLAAVHVPTPSDPFLDSHHTDASSLHLRGSPFFWWEETGTEGAAAKWIVELGQAHVGLDGIGEATLCDPFVSVEVHGGRFSGAGPVPASDGDDVIRSSTFAGSSGQPAYSPVTHQGTWESKTVQGNGLSAHWEAGTCFDIVASHPEITQAVLTINHRKGAGEKAKPLALASINLACVRTGVRCLSLCEPKHGLPLRFTKLLLRVSREPLPLECLPAATRGSREVHSCCGSISEAAQAFKGGAVNPRSLNETLGSDNAATLGACAEGTVYATAMGGGGGNRRGGRRRSTHMSSVVKAAVGAVGLVSRQGRESDTTGQRQGRRGSLFTTRILQQSRVTSRERDRPRVDEVGATARAADLEEVELNAASAS